MKIKSNNYELYPPITPFNYGFIEVEGHNLYFEECGNPNGIPIIFFMVVLVQVAIQNIEGYLIQKFFMLFF